MHADDLKKNYSNGSAEENRRSSPLNFDTRREAHSELRDLRERVKLLEQRYDKLNKEKRQLEESILYLARNTLHRWGTLGHTVRLMDERISRYVNFAPMRWMRSIRKKILKV